MSELLLTQADGASVPLHLVRASEAEPFLARRRAGVAVQVRRQEFKAKAGQTAAVIRADGSLELALLGLGDGADAQVIRAAYAMLKARFG